MGELMRQRIRGVSRFRPEPYCERGTRSCPAVGAASMDHLAVVENDRAAVDGSDDLSPFRKGRGVDGTSGAVELGVVKVASAHPSPSVAANDVAHRSRDRVSITERNPRSGSVSNPVVRILRVLVPADRAALDAAWELVEDVHRPDLHEASLHNCCGGLAEDWLVQKLGDADTRQLRFGDLYESVGRVFELSFTSSRRRAGVVTSHEYGVYARACLFDGGCGEQSRHHTVAVVHEAFMKRANHRHRFDASTTSMAEVRSTHTLEG